MKLKIGNIEQEFKFMNKLYMENRFSEIVIRGQILNKKFPNIVPVSYTHLTLPTKA